MDINILVLCNNLNDIYQDINLLYFKIEIFKIKQSKGNIIIYTIENINDKILLDLIVFARCTSNQIRQINLNQYLNQLNEGGYLYVTSQEQISTRDYINFFNGALDTSQADNFTRSTGSSTQKYISIDPVIEKSRKPICQMYVEFETILYNMPMDDIKASVEYLTQLIKSLEADGKTSQILFPLYVFDYIYILNIFIRSFEILRRLIYLYGTIIENNSLLLLLLDVDTHVFILMGKMEKLSSKNRQFLSLKETLKKLYENVKALKLSLDIEKALELSSRSNLTSNDYFNVYRATLALQQGLLSETIEKNRIILSTALKRLTPILEKIKKEKEKEEN